MRGMKPDIIYQEGDITHFDGKDWEFHDGKFREMKRSAVDKFYLALWRLLGVLMILAFVGLIVWLRVQFDSWYVHWLMK